MQSLSNQKYYKGEHNKVLTVGHGAKQVIVEHHLNLVSAK